ncbi:MAG: hypothetical protein HYV09_05965 [Deltaproteobacteria bacterium]|nr:hypothetical protein [Deltaproteobacteria bacterium]
MSARVLMIAGLALSLVACADEERGASTPVEAGTDAPADTTPPRSDAPAPNGLGTDAAVVAACTAGGCHAEVATRWANPSSHRLLHDCLMCHATVSGTAPGKGHVDEPACAKCHSEATHRTGTACVTCHEPHGSKNVFLLRESIALADGGATTIHVAAPEGASADGLVRAGVDGGVPGTGLCEVCHTTTAHYRRDGVGAPHHGDWCGRCHEHARGFAVPM